MIFGRISINDVAENQRVKQRENLVRGRQKKSNHNQIPMLFRIAKEKIHRRFAADPSQSNFDAAVQGIDSDFQYAWPASSARLTPRGRALLARSFVFNRYTGVYARLPRSGWCVIPKPAAEGSTKNLDTQNGLMGCKLGRGGQAGLGWKALGGKAIRPTTSRRRLFEALTQTCNSFGSYQTSRCDPATRKRYPGGKPKNFTISGNCSTKCSVWRG